MPPGRTNSQAQNSAVTVLLPTVWVPIEFFGQWKGEKVFALDIGNAGGIEGEFNGKPLGSFGEAGKTAHVTLKAQ